MNNNSLWKYLGESFSFFSKVLAAIRKSPILSFVWGFEVLILVFTVIIFILGGLPDNGRLIVAILNVFILTGVLVFTILKMEPPPQNLMTINIIVHEKGIKTRTISDAKIIYILDTPQEVYTESNGSKLISIPNFYIYRKITMSAEKDGYKSVEREISLKNARTDPKVYIELEKAPIPSPTSSIFVDLSRGQKKWYSFESFVNKDSRLSPIENKGFSIDKTSVLMIALPFHDEEYTQQEADDLDKWVKSGGGLFLLGYYAADTHHLSKPSYLARKFGFEFNNDLIMPAKRSKEIYCRKQGAALDADLAIPITINPLSSSHPVLSHINEVYFLSSCSVSIIPNQQAEYLLKSPSESAIMKPDGNLDNEGYMPMINRWNLAKNDTVPVLAARQYGKGKVVVAGTWKICTLDYKDNRLLVNNILDWLSKPAS